MFDPEEKTWSNCRPLKLNRSGFTACLVTGLPNPEAYAYVAELMENRGLKRSTEYKSDV
jgi:hypothetical protein